MNVVGSAPLLVSRKNALALFMVGAPTQGISSAELGNRS